MKTPKRWIALIVLLGIVGFLSAGCRGQAQDTAANEAAREAATEPAPEAAAEAAAEPAAGGEETAAEPVRITADQLIDVFAGSDVLLLDVRTPEEIEEQGTVEGYLNIPIEELEARLDEVPRDRPILTA
jgi:hypothetical protein